MPIQKVKLNLNLGIIFLETNVTNRLMQQHGQNNLTNLPYTFWFRIFSFLSMFDIISLFTSSEKLKFLICNSHHKTLFEITDNVCNEKFGFVY